MHMLADFHRVRTNEQIIADEAKLQMPRFQRRLS